MDLSATHGRQPSSLPSGDFPVTVGRLRLCACVFFNRRGPDPATGMGPDPSGGFAPNGRLVARGLWPVACSSWLTGTLQHLVSRTPDAALTTYHVRRATQSTNPLQPVAASREEPKPLARRLWSAGRRLPNDGSPPGMDPGSHPLRGFARGNEKAACSGWLAACSQQNDCGLRPAPDKARSLGGGLGRGFGAWQEP